MTSRTSVPGLTVLQWSGSTPRSGTSRAPAGLQGLSLIHIFTPAHDEGAVIRGLEGAHGGGIPGLAHPTRARPQGRVEDDERQDRAAVQCR